MTKNTTIRNNCLWLFYFIFFSVTNIYAQGLLIKGKVTNKAGEPLSGVTIALEGSSASTASSADGSYSLQVNNGDGNLVTSYIGYQSSKIAIANRTIINIILELEAEALDEVVVVGYGTMRKSDLTGAVASVNAKSLNTIPTGNPVEALQGKIAGVNIGAVTAPGTTPQIRIRGNRSLNASNDPLYVVDGIPRNTIADIPVTDIESIEVLKDASSAAIYGSRGANGVILVSTKRAQANSSTSISLNTYAGINQAKFPEMMSGQDYVQFRRDVFRATHNDGWNSGAPNNENVFGPRELAIVNSGDFIDWQDLMFRKRSATQEYNLSVAHGSEKTQMLISLGYRQEQGYYKNNDVDRLNLGINLDHKISDIVKVGISSRLTNSNVDDFTAPGTNMLYMNPTSQPYDENGNMIWNPSTQQTAAWNILADYQEPYINKNDVLRSFNVLYAEINLSKDLKLRSNIGIDIEDEKSRQYQGSSTTLRYGRADYAEKRDHTEIGLVWDNILTFDRLFGKHHVTATAVTSYQRQTTNAFSASGEGFPGEELEDWNLASATQNLSIESSYEKWALGSLLGRFQYGYDNRYLFNFSIRADGSSVLAEGNQWGYFPAISGAWTISNEDFFTSSFINNLKLRTSYGVVGNSAIAPYATIAGTTQTTYNFGEQTYYGYKLGGLVNKELGWEYSKTLNMGVDYSLFGSRISGTFELYQTITSDLLMERSLPEFTGSSLVFQNVGKTQNTGFEAMITTSNIATSDFTWNTDINFYANREKIVSLLSDEDMVGNGWFIGRPIGVYYNYEKLGIWQLNESEEAAGFQRRPGDPKIKDQNGDGVIDADHDRIVLGQTSPKFGLFFRNSFTYHGFNLAIALEGKFGNYVNSSMLGSDLFFDGTRWGPQALANNYWTPDNPSGEYPYVNRAVETYATLFGIRKASYLNVQELSLGYSFDKLGPFKGVNIYGRAKNLLYLYRADQDLDPQAPNFDNAAYKTFVLGLNISL